MPARHGVEIYFVFEVPEEEDEEEVATRRKQLSHEQFDVWKYGYQEGDKYGDIGEEEIDDPVERQREKSSKPSDKSESTLYKVSMIHV